MNDKQERLISAVGGATTMILGLRQRGAARYISLLQKMRQPAVVFCTGGGPAIPISGNGTGAVKTTSAFGGMKRLGLRTQSALSGRHFCPSSIRNSI